MLDTITITVQSGKGWDGCVSARREAGVPFWGPAGGDGGKWGDIIFRASKDEQTLIEFRQRSTIVAQDGQDGMIKDRYGANALDKYIVVPIGTIITDIQSGMIIFQFTQDGEEYTVARGGKGGAGNIHFKNAVNQYPNFALLGEPGHTRELRLELQMLGDVGLIGTPSVGKSSLINTCCATKVKTADYHFTTLEPNIGICSSEPKTFSMVDIPGLVEGASQWKGLGNEFLRHILKARIFALVVDIDSYEAGFEKLTTVFDEIIMYIQQRFIGSTEFGEAITSIELHLQTEDDGSLLLHCIAHRGELSDVLFQKAIHIVANKYDMVNDLEIAQEFTHELARHLSRHFKAQRWWSVSEQELLAHTFIVSAATHYGIKERTSALATLIERRDIAYRYLFDTVVTQEIVHTFLTDSTESDLPMLLEEWYLDPSATRAKVWEIRDPEICRLVNILPRGNEQAEHRFWNVMMKKKYLSDLEKAGVLHGDVLKIMSYYNGVDDRYIMYV